MVEKNKVVDISSGCVTTRTLLSALVKFGFRLRNTQPGHFPDGSPTDSGQLSPSKCTPANSSERKSTKMQASDGGNVC
jgi:hypothetical protein